MFGLGSNGGSDDKEQHTGDSQRASDDGPGISLLALHDELVFHFDELLFRVVFSGKPSSLSRG